MIRAAVAGDFSGILALYRQVAEVPGGIARTPAEVSEAYVAGFMERAREDGVELVAEVDGRIVAEIHAARPGIACFASVLSDLTICVSPDAQGQGLGRTLFQALLASVQAMPDIGRVELFVRESNQRAYAMYRSLGFEEEGRCRARIRHPGGLIEQDIMMGWIK